MIIPFIKASACGNDFLLIDAREAEGKIAAGEMAGFTKKICDRHNGIGADGVEWIYPAGEREADAEIRLINADGSEAEISGNGTRCVAAYLCDTQKSDLQKKETICILTGAGIKRCSFMGKNGSDYSFETEMGAATVGGKLGVKLEAGQIQGITVSVGNPHFVFFVDGFAQGWQRTAEQIQQSADFREHGVNVETVMVDGEHDITARFFERGAGETQSSGTGSCAAAVASVSAGRAKFPLRVHASGGTQSVRQEENVVYLLGPARLVCRGDFFLE